MNLKELKNQAKKELKTAKNREEIKALEKKYLGKKSEIARALSGLKDLDVKKRIKAGKEINDFKRELSFLFEKKLSGLKGAPEQSDYKKIDITAPGKSFPRGHLHPITLVRREAEEIFSKLGFEIAEGPEIESEWYNFDALNIPKDHPARDMWDTFWLRQNEVKNQKSKIKNEFKIQNSKFKTQTKGRFLLRTHTSPVQIRYMEKHNPPLRIIAPGRCFRYEATDASHEINFYHIEGLMVDEKVSASNFKAIIKKFFEQFFKKEVKLRIRPSYFPFTEPSFEVDIECLVCGGKGCSACSQRGWIEMAGAGMVHPNVFKAVKLNPKNWQGFAFGMGLDRLTMMKYKIEDMRLFFSSDLRFLEQF